MIHTKYSFLSDDEFLAIVEERLGKSPIVDELQRRFTLVLGDSFDNEALESEIEELSNTLESYKSINKCSICEASLGVSK